MEVQRGRLNHAREAGKGRLRGDVLFALGRGCPGRGGGKSIAGRGNSMNRGTEVGKRDQLSPNPHSE